MIINDERWKEENHEDGLKGVRNETRWNEDNLWKVGG